MIRASVDNPFTYGNPISDPRRFFGRRREVQQIFSRLRNTEFESSSIIGDRRIGKTSMLNYLANAETRAAYGLDAPAQSFVYVDLQMVEVNMTPAQLWIWLLKKLAAECSNDDTRALVMRESVRTLDAFGLDELFQELDRKGQGVVFLLDEFENITRNEHFGPDFYFGLRSLAIHHKLALVTSSRRELIDLCHSAEIRSSPFFNIFANVPMSLFSESDAHELITATLAPTGIRFSQSEIQYVLNVAGLHPLFLQIACHFLYEAHLMEWDEATRLASVSQEFAKEARPHLASAWRNSIEREKITLTALALLEHESAQHRRYFRVEELKDIYATSDLTLSQLKRRGLVIALRDSYALSTAIFTDWIISEMKSQSEEEPSYEEWIASREGMMGRLSGHTREGLRELLPRMSNGFRDLVATWLADPKTAVTAILLLKRAFALDGR